MSRMEPYAKLRFLLLLAAILVLMFFLDFFRYGAARLYSLKEPLALIKMVLYVLSIACLARNPNLFMRFLKFIVYLAVFNAIIVLLVGFYVLDLDLMVWGKSEAGRSVMGHRLPFRRTSGLFNHHGYFGMYLVLAMSIVLYFRDKFRSSRLLLALLLGAAMVSQSRGMWLAVILLLGCYGLFWLGNKPRLAWILISSMLILLVAALPFLYDLATSAYDTLVSIKSNTVNMRLKAFSLALRLVGDVEIAGAGFRAWGATENPHVLHNMYLAVLLGAGVLSLFVLLVLLSLPVLFQMFYRRQYVAFSVTAWLPCLLIVNFVSGLSYYSLWCVMGILLGLCVLPGPGELGRVARLRRP